MNITSNNLFSLSQPPLKIRLYKGLEKAKGRTEKPKEKPQNSTHGYYKEVYEVKLYVADLLPALKGEGSDGLTPRQRREGLRGFI